MNFVKRAYLYTTRKKVRTILLFSIILIMATLLIVCFSINSSSNMANANVRKALKCGLTVNAKTLENGLEITDEEEISSYDVAYTAEVSLENLSEDTVSLLQEQMTNDINKMYENIIAKKNWDAVKDSYHLVMQKWYFLHRGLLCPETCESYGGRLS